MISSDVISLGLVPLIFPCQFCCRVMILAISFLTGILLLAHSSFSACKLHTTGFAYVDFLLSVNAVFYTATV
jgi:hypothetical protein